MSEREREPVGGRRAIQVGYATLVLAFGGFGTWAALAPLDSASVAAGEIEVEGHDKSVQHRDGGIVKEILVSEGDRVKAGQPLIRLDDTIIRARWGQLQSQYWDDLATKARLLAERDGASSIDFDKVMPSETYSHLPEVEQAQTNLFVSRKRLIDGQVAVLQKRIAQFQKQADALLVEQTSKDRQLTLIQEQVETARKLFQAGLELKPHLLALEADGERLQGERDDFAARIAQVQQGIASTQLEIANVNYRHLEEVAGTLRDVESDIRKVDEERSAIHDKLRRTVIRAPQDGVVVNMKIHTIGAVIGAGDRIMTVVPEDERLVVVARVRPEDIDRVRVGRRAQVRFHTFLPDITPPAHGTVTRVSADLLHDQRTGLGYYQARIRLDPASLRRLPGPPLPGMQADVLINTGARTVLEYLADPLARAMHLAMREK